jgi:heme/copper-type cytochrome/quinol oxidase subunit 3
LSLALREPWDSLRRQREAASFGMWIFLGSEAMLFGALMLALAANRTLHPDAFAAAGLPWIGFMFALTMADQRTREPPTQPGTVTPETTASAGAGKPLF